MKSFAKLFLVCFLACCGAVSAGAQNMALKTNVLPLAAGCPNLDFEIVSGARTSLDFTFAGAYNPYRTDIKFFTFQPEFRYWLAGRPMIREYIGVSLSVSTYDLVWKDKGFKGDAVGAGLSFGYALPVRPRFTIDFSVGLGLFYFRQHRYDASAQADGALPSGNVSVNDKGLKLLPSRIGVTLSYIFR